MQGGAAHAEIGGRAGGSGRGGAGEGRDIRAEFSVPGTLYPAAITPRLCVEGGRLCSLARILTHKPQSSRGRLGAAIAHKLRANATHHRARRPYHSGQNLDPPAAAAGAGAGSFAAAVAEANTEDGTDTALGPCSPWKREGGSCFFSPSPPAPLSVFSQKS